MADQHDHPSKRNRTAPPPFVGPPRAGALAPKTRADRPTLPPFSPPFVKRPSPAVPVVLDARQDETPNEPTPAGEVGIGWVNPDQPPVGAPAQAATGIDWLDSPAAEASAPTTPLKPSAEDDDDVFGWDPAEERGGALDRSHASVPLDALKELEPWALPGSELSGATSDDVAAALERVAARIRSGDLFVPGASTGTTEEAALASVLAALLQRARG
jgi:hypothetical protein